MLIFKFNVLLFLMIIAANDLAKGQTFEGFIELSQRLNWKVKEVQCFIIFEKNDSIPYEVIMIPIKKQHSNIDTQFRITLEDNSFGGQLVYFQSLRWANPDLLEQLEKADGIEGMAVGQIWFKNSFVRIVRGTFYFVVNFLPRGLLNPLCDKILLTSESFAPAITLSVVDAPREMGFPYYFKCFDK